ncbi:MAG: hypothetical protein AAF098_19995 [Pseudomonadota bacterium]
MSILNRIDDRYAVEHSIDRQLIPRFEPKNGNECARLLLLLERPGPGSVGTPQTGGSGVISQFNEDVTARMLRAQLELADIAPADLCITNIVPHVRSARARVSDEQVNQAEIEMGFTRLLEVVDAIAPLQNIVLFGNKAKLVKNRLRDARPWIELHDAFHTSAQASGGGRNPESSKNSMWEHNVHLMKTIRPKHWGQI